MTRELTIQTIRQAQAGNVQCLSAVAEQVRQKVYTYIYRLTLDYHLTQDLTQETVLEMIKSLSQLEVPHVNGFWGWVFRTAHGKVQHHFCSKAPSAWQKRRPPTDSHWRPIRPIVATRWTSSFAKRSGTRCWAR